MAPHLESNSPFALASPADHLYRQSLSSVLAAMSYHEQHPGKSKSHRRSTTASVMPISSSSISQSGNLRLAEVAKQHCMGIHTEDWREDVSSPRQYLPMQHIIGSLKRDHDEMTDYTRNPVPPSRQAGRQSIQQNISSMSPTSEDFFIQSLGMPKRRRTLDAFKDEEQTLTNLEPQWHFRYQDSADVAKELQRAASSGLDHISNLSTTATNEQEFYSEYAQQDLEDSQLLMNEVLRLQENTTDDEPGELDDSTSTIDEMSPIVPPEREIEVRKAFEEFIDFSDSKRYIAKI